MPTGEERRGAVCGKSHARFDEAAGGNQASRLDRAASAPPADPTATLVISPATDVLDGRLAHSAMSAA
jgi:hypothetical protein